LLTEHAHDSFTIDYDPTKEGKGKKSLARVAKQAKKLKNQDQKMTGVNTPSVAL
jgi:hypothetical protein